MANVIVLKQHLAELSDDYQNIIILRYVDELSIKQVSAIVGKKEGAVKVALQRALKELRKKMAS